MVFFCIAKGVFFMVSSDKKFTDYESMVMLDLPEDESVRLSERYDEIVSGFDVLDDIDVSSALPLVSVLELQNVMREDVASKLISRDELLKNAPEQHEGYIQVPAAID